MKFIKLSRKFMDSEDNVFEPGSTLEVSDETATELIEAEKGEITEAPAVKKIDEVNMKEDLQKEIKSALEDAMKEIKTEEKEISGSTVEVTEDAPIWKDSGEFLQAVVKAGRSNTVDERLYKGSGEGQEEADNSEGGYLVERRIGTEIYKLAAQESILYPKCDIKEVGPNANGVKINQVNESTRSATTLFGGVRIYSMAEGATKTAFIQTYAQIDVPLGKLAAVFYATDELLQDRVALKSFITEDVGKGFAWIIDDDILHGTTNTAMIEIENHAATVQVTVAGANPTADELTNMYTAMAPGSISRAEWYLSLSQYAAIMQLEDTSGRKLIQPSFEISAYGTLYGRPVNVIEQADIDANDTSIMFLDLSQYLVIKRGGIAEASSMHVKFLEDEMAFRFVLRIAGTPKLSSTVTLPDSSVISPFVTRD